MIDRLVERLTTPAPSEARERLTAIPWPKGLEPQTVDYHGKPDGPMPHADVLVLTWTAAEKQALADVLTPGLQYNDWNRYPEHWSAYESQLTGRSPAHYAKCMASYALTRINGLTVATAGSNLHLATDGDSAPIVQLWKQMIDEVEPELVITTGTAGGIGASTVLGDVAIAAAAQFNCQKNFKDKPWAHTRYVSEPYTAGPHVRTTVPTLMSVNAPQLRPVATRDPQLMFGDVETVDYFGFDDTDDSYGIVKADSRARTEEMDDATLPLALSQWTPATDTARVPRWLSIRNASDPMVPSSLGSLEKQSEWASHIYLKYGYYTTVGSAIATWGVIADL